MTEPVSEATWRNRFILVNLLRIGATVVVLTLLLLWDRGRIPALIALPLALAALTVSFFGPRWLARRWRTPPAP